ncbi:MAG: helix-turn-helix transcriptional regulator [Eubacterium sp.]|nr:helix-turn-helix transcriptional regulator [Eubacterium sp.]
METHNIAIDSSSVWTIGTPSEQAMKLPFYLLEHGHFIASDDYYTLREKSRQYLLFYTLSGEGELIYSGVKYCLPKNSVCVIWCDPVHSYRTVPGKPWDFVWFHFNGTAAREFYDLYNNGKTLFISEMPPDAVDTMFSILSAKLDDSISGILLRNELATHLMTSLIRNKLKLEQDASPEIMDKVNTAILYMRKNLSRKISLEDIAACTFTSKYYFIHIFKKQLGITPYQYLLHLRINKAKELLNTTELCLEEIAQQSGFCDSKNLICNFKKVTQMTPGQYRDTSITGMARSPEE